MVAEKDVYMSKHPKLVDKNVPNLHVVSQPQGHVKKRFYWRRFYWYPTKEGSP